MRSTSLLAPILFLSSTLGLLGTVPSPKFKAPVVYSGGGTSVVRVIGAQRTPKFVNGVDTGADVYGPLDLNGDSTTTTGMPTWDVVSADHDKKLIRIRLQSTASPASYTNLDITTTGSPTDLAVENVSNHLAKDLITTGRRRYSRVLEHAGPGRGGQSGFRGPDHPRRHGNGRGSRFISTKSPWRMSIRTGCRTSSASARPSSPGR